MFGIEWVCFERRRESKSRCKILKIVDLVLAPLGWVVIKNGDEDDAWSYCYYIIWWRCYCAPSVGPSISACPPISMPTPVVATTTTTLVPITALIPTTLAPIVAPPTTAPTPQYLDNYYYRNSTLWWIVVEIPCSGN